ncbi:TPA: hypothetical protein RFY30_000711 [Klebsiella aerogenes]|nr:hypothetical protein [Klebsiella aerogenes]
MTPVKEFGECLITSGDKEYFFRPSLLAMTRIGEPAEIVQTFYDLCNDEATPLIQQAAQVYIRDEYSRLPDCVLRYIQSGLLSRKAVMAAHAVLTACCDDDIGELVGWMKPGKSRKRGFMWRSGTMPAPEMIIVAQNLMMHGIIGKAKVRKLQRHETSDTTNEFRASEYIVAARNHFGISKEEAWQLTMTEFQLMLIAKYPEQKGYTREEYDHAAGDYFARRKRRKVMMEKES